MSQFHCNLKGCSHDFEAESMPERCPKCGESNWCMDRMIAILAKLQAKVEMAIGQLETL